jgi:hypothetical protein
LSIRFQVNERMHQREKETQALETTDEH